MVAGSSVASDMYYNHLSGSDLSVKVCLPVICPLPIVMGTAGQSANVAITAVISGILTMKRGWTGRMWTLTTRHETVVGADELYCFCDVQDKGIEGHVAYQVCTAQSGSCHDTNPDEQPVPRRVEDP